MSDEQMSIFDILNQINKKNYKFLGDLPENERKSIQPLVLMRWMSGINSSEHDQMRTIMYINELANPYIFSLYQHQDLLWKQLCVCSPGKHVKYNWLKREKHSSNKSLEVIKEYYKYSTKEASQILPLLTCTDIISMAEHLGYESSDITKIKKEWK